MNSIIRTANICKWCVFIFSVRMIAPARIGVYISCRFLLTILSEAEKGLVSTPRELARNRACSQESPENVVLPISSKSSPPSSHQSSDWNMWTPRTMSDNLTPCRNSRTVVRNLTNALKTMYIIYHHLLRRSEGGYHK